MLFWIKVILKIRNDEKHIKTKSLVFPFIICNWMTPIHAMPHSLYRNTFCGCKEEEKVLIVVISFYFIDIVSGRKVGFSKKMFYKCVWPAKPQNHRMNALYDKNWVIICDLLESVYEFQISSQCFTLYVVNRKTNWGIEIFIQMTLRT